MAISTLWECFGASLGTAGNVFRDWRRCLMKKIAIRKAGPVRLTSAACYSYHVGA
jgi:hypothetical protein